MWETLQSEGRREKTTTVMEVEERWKERQNRKVKETRETDQNSQQKKVKGRKQNHEGEQTKKKVIQKLCKRENKENKCSEYLN